MSYILSTDKQVAVIGALAEGSSIRSIERQTGIHRDTIMRLGVRIGEACGRIMDEKMQNLDCQRLQLDEIWGFIGKKQKNVEEGEEGLGDAWTFIAVDADTKIVPAFRVGKRDTETANAFVEDLAGRLKNRPQISTDGLRAYVDAIERGFGTEVDYGQIVKTFSTAEGTPQGRYSPPQVVRVDKAIINGHPAIDKISTSYVERQNLTLRMHCRRLTRLTLSFSKKLENFKAAVSLNFAYYNFVKVHKTLRATPAMAAGVTSTLWTAKDLVDMCNG